MTSSFWKRYIWGLLSETTFSIHLLQVEDTVKLMQSSLSSFPYPLSRNCRQLPSLLSFQLYVSIHSWHLSVRQVSNSWEALPGFGKKSIPGGSCSLLRSISQYLNTTAHCDDIDSLEDMYLKCLAMSDIIHNKKIKQGERNFKMSTFKVFKDIKKFFLWNKNRKLWNSTLILKSSIDFNIRLKQ